MTKPRNPPELINQLVTDNFKLARWWARKFEYRSSYNEALSLAMEGLLIAATKYEPAQGIPFGTYASIRIKWLFAGQARRDGAQVRGGDCQHLSLDKQRFHDDTRTLADELADAQPGPRELAQGEDLRDEVAEMLASVPERTRKILEMRYGLNGHEPTLFGEIARRFKVTHQAVQQIEAAALRKFWRNKQRKKLEPVRCVA